MSKRRFGNIGAKYGCLAKQRTEKAEKEKEAKEKENYDSKTRNMMTKFIFIFEVIFFISAIVMLIIIIINSLINVIYWITWVSSISLAFVLISIILKKITFRWNLLFLMLSFILSFVVSMNDIPNGNPNPFNGLSIIALIATFSLLGVIICQANIFDLKNSKYPAYITNYYIAYICMGSAMLTLISTIIAFVTVFYPDK